MIRRILRWIEYKQHTRTLSELPDHILKDIGLDRSNINSIAYYKTYLTKK
ncbi:MAG: hypothetical protein CMO44_15290 [Verrucomicrobiales bacterium]|mgnify:CR=1|jgi:uncharacterized protein YjiS (DUF1127 family)|nr:hypothetical protein [Verrucomicrobiales bacterium]